MTFLQIAILALIQGAAELLPVSSSAHVIFAERWMGLDPSAPELTFLLVMLHTGTMFAVLHYFWPKWRDLLFKRGPAQIRFIRQLAVATACTGVFGIALKVIIERLILEKILGHTHGEIESLFRELPLIAAALTAVGILILLAARREPREGKSEVENLDAICIGVVQGLCLPFRGFSRSGATISAAFFRGIPRELAENFSFALAVILTPPVIAKELLRLLKHHSQGAALNIDYGSALLPGLVGMSLSFVSGYFALRLLSSWLEKGRWKYFGYYCLGAAAVMLLGHFSFVRSASAAPCDVVSISQVLLRTREVAEFERSRRLLRAAGLDFSGVPNQEIPALAALVSAPPSRSGELPMTGSREVWAQLLRARDRTRPEEEPMVTVTRDPQGGYRVRRTGRSWESEHELAPNAISGDPRNFLFAAGGNLGRFFGYVLVDDQYLRTPELNEFNQRIGEVNQVLLPGARIRLRFYGGTEDGGFPKSRDYLIRYARDGSLPRAETAEAGAAVHDLSAHDPSIFLPSEELALSQTQTQALLDFISFVQRVAPAFSQIPQISRYFDQAIHLQASAIDIGNGNFGETLGDVRTINGDSRIMFDPEGDGVGLVTAGERVFHFGHQILTWNGASPYQFLQVAVGIRDSQSREFRFPIHTLTEPQRTTLGALLNQFLEERRMLHPGDSTMDRGLDHRNANEFMAAVRAQLLRVEAAARIVEIRNRNRPESGRDL